MAGPRLLLGLESGFKSAQRRKEINTMRWGEGDEESDRFSFCFLHATRGGDGRGESGLKGYWRVNRPSMGGSGLKGCCLLVRTYLYHQSFQRIHFHFSGSGGAGGETREWGEVWGKVRKEETRQNLKTTTTI